MKIAFAQIAMVLNYRPECIGCRLPPIRRTRTCGPAAKAWGRWFNALSETKPGIQYQGMREQAQVRRRLGAQHKQRIHLGRRRIPPADKIFASTRPADRRLLRAGFHFDTSTRRPKANPTDSAPRADQRHMQKVHWGLELGRRSSAPEFAKQLGGRQHGGVQREIYGAFEDLRPMYLPRLCRALPESGLRGASCPSGAICERRRDGITS